MNSTYSIEVDSLVKENESEGKKKKGMSQKGILTKKWKACYDKVLIPFLVDLVSNGYKIHKTFKDKVFCYGRESRQQRVQ